MSLKSLTFVASLLASPSISFGQDIIGPARPFTDNGDNITMNLMQDELRCMEVELDSVKNLRMDLLNNGPEYVGSHFFFWGEYQSPTNQVFSNATYSNPNLNQILDQEEKLQTFQLTCVSSIDHQPIREDWENALVTDMFIATSGYEADATFKVDAVQYEYGRAYGYNKASNASDYHVRLAGMADITNPELAVEMVFQIRDKYCPCPTAQLIPY
jgi:hypothetical protein